MCFSASASFSAAAVTGAIGVATVSRVHSRNEFPLAVMPIFFAVQQTIEALLWINIPDDPSGRIAAGLTQLFLLFALVFWPVYAPFASLSIEDDLTRRKWISVCMFAGLVVSGYFLWSLIAGPRTANILNGHVVYSGDPTLPMFVLYLYPAATCLAPMLSSHKAVRLMGLLVFLGSLAAYIAYSEAFASVWCFFAAASSGVILYQFETARRQRQSEIVTAE
jgi:hypothetical protein